MNLQKRVAEEKALVEFFGGKRLFNEAIREMAKRLADAIDKDILDEYLGFHCNLLVLSRG